MNNYNVNKLSGYASIYKITNAVNDKVYIGFTTYKICYRWAGHKYAYRYRNYKSILHRAINKYGIENFKIEELYCSKDKGHTLRVMETYFINEYNSHKKGYNTSLGDIGPLGVVFSKERCENIAKAKRGKKYMPQILETRLKRCKYRYIIEFPSGQIIETLDLRTFCQENTLDRNHMLSVAKNKHGRTQHKGFKVKIQNV